MREFVGKDGVLTGAILKDDTKLEADMCVVGVGKAGSIATRGIIRTFLKLHNYTRAPAIALLYIMSISMCDSVFRCCQALFPLLPI